MMAQAIKKPPFRKRGVGGISPRLIPTKGRIQADALAGDYPLPEACGRIQLFVMQGEGEIPPSPLLRKGGFLWLAPATPRRPLCVPLRLCVKSPVPCYEARGNPPNPPLAKGGLFKACAIIPRRYLYWPILFPTVPYHHSGPYRHSRASGNPHPGLSPRPDAHRGSGFRPAPE